MPQRSSSIGTGVGTLAALVLLLCFLLVPVACRDGSDEGGTAPRVVVSLAPLGGLVRSVLGEGTAVGVLIPPGVSPHAWEARPADLAMLRRAELVVINGAGVERGLMDMIRASDRPGRTVIVLARLGEHARSDAHGHDDARDIGGAHDHDAHGESHLWLDFAAVRDLVRRVGAWSGRDAGRALARIDEIERDYRTRLASYQGTRVITDHRAWDGLLGRFGIEVVGVLRAGEHGELSPGRLAQVVAQIREAGVRAVLVEVQFSARESERIAEAARVPVARLDPIGGEDWFAMMRANLDAIGNALEGGGDSDG